MKIEPKLIDQPIEVDNRLSKLGVDKDLLLDVVSAANAGRNNCTNNHPRSAPGWMSWSEGNCRLRECLFEKNEGWEWDETDNIPSVLNRKLKIKITVSNTDFGTGLKHHHPQQMSHKGSATDRIVFQNQGFFEKLFEKTKNLVPLLQPHHVACWYLCVFCEGDIVRAELSCPVRCEDGLFKDFYERIILIGEDGDSTGVRVRKQEPDGGDSELDIPVTRKQAL
jgi:hypothetical protein